MGQLESVLCCLASSEQARSDLNPPVRAHSDLSLSPVSSIIDCGIKTLLLLIYMFDSICKHAYSVMLLCFFWFSSIFYS